MQALSQLSYSPKAPSGSVGAALNYAPEGPGSRGWGGELRGRLAGWGGVWLAFHRSRSVALALPAVTTSGR